MRALPTASFPGRGRERAPQAGRAGSPVNAARSRGWKTAAPRGRVRPAILQLLELCLFHLEMKQIVGADLGVGPFWGRTRRAATVFVAFQGEHGIMGRQNAFIVRARGPEFSAWQRARRTSARMLNWSKIILRRLRSLPCSETYQVAENSTYSPHSDKLTPPSRTPTCAA